MLLGDGSDLRQIASHKAQEGGMLCLEHPGLAFPNLLLGPDLTEKTFAGLLRVP